MNSVTLLPFYQKCTLDSYDVSLHRLNLRTGLSNLPEYADSYFCCLQQDLASCNARSFRVMRVPKNDLEILGGIGRLLPRGLWNLVREERLLVPYQKYEMTEAELFTDLGLDISTGTSSRPFFVDSYFYTKSLGGRRFEVVRVPKEDIQIYEGRVAYLTQIEWEVLLVGSHRRSLREEFKIYLFEHEKLLPTHSSGKQFKVIIHRNKFVDLRLGRIPLLTKEEFSQWQIDDKGFSSRPEFRKCVFEVKCHKTSEGEIYEIKEFHAPLKINEDSATFISTAELVGLQLVSIESGEPCNGPGVFKSNNLGENRLFKVVELPATHPSYETYELTVCKE